MFFDAFGRMGAVGRSPAGRNGEFSIVSLARVHSSSVLFFLRGSWNPDSRDTGFRAVQLKSMESCL